MSLLVLTLVLILPMSVAMADVTGMVRIIDGDTIWISGTKIRLHGIDAPETKQECRREDGSESLRGSLYRRPTRPYRL